MSNIKKIIDRLYPFNFLSRAERKLITDNAVQKLYQRDDIILEKNNANEYLYIIYEGTVDVIGQKNEFISSIIGPAYFAERSVIFRRSLKYTFVARTQVECYKIKGEIIFKLIAENQFFSNALATTLRRKQKIFQDHEKFITQLLGCRTRGSFTISELSDKYQKLTPALHKYCSSETIDFAALKYVLARLPEDITNTSEFYLAQSLPEAYQQIFQANQSALGYKYKRYHLNVYPGKTMIILRDELTDYISFITKLCVYHQEAKKIVIRLIKKPNMIAKITQMYLESKNGDNSNGDELLSILPFSEEEKSQLQQLFYPNIAKKLYELVAQNGGINIRLHDAKYFYSASASENWLNAITLAISSLFGDDSDFHDVKFHIISSNIHSVNNSLSSWMRKHKKEILDWGKKNVPELSKLVDENDKLYHTAKKWFKVYPEKFEDRKKSDFMEGITYCPDSSLTGMDVSVINLEKLVGDCDSHISIPDREKLKNNVIINLDYAFGQQVEISIRNLILLLGKQIKTFSVVGKAGGIHGNRGDIFIPKDIIMQKNDNIYPVINSNLHPDDLKNLGWKNEIHTGDMLTVLGTLMQNADMLKYYNLFWNVLALDMEAGYFMKEIDKAFFQKHLVQDIKIHMAYYISDKPLDSEHNLSEAMSPEEGVPAVYTITRAVLNKIFISIDSKEQD